MDGQSLDISIVKYLLLTFQIYKFFRQNLKRNKVIARGHGCSSESSYTDGVRFVDTRNLDKILNYDKERIVVEAGVRLSDILTLTLKDDLFFQKVFQVAWI